MYPIFISRLSSYQFRLTLTFLMIVALSACGQSQTDTEYLEKAAAHFKKDEYAAASIEAKNALQQNPDNPEARALLGRLYVLLGDPESAEKELLRAQELNSTDESLAAPLVRALVLQGKVDDALAVSLDGLSDSDKAEALVSQGLGLTIDEQKSAANEKLGKALELDPRSPYALTTHARLAASEGEFDSARDRLRQALAQSSEYVPALELLGDIEWSQHNYEAAEQSFVEVKDLRKNDLYTTLKIVQLQLLQGKLEETRKAVETLIEKTPKDPLVNFIDGLVKFEEKNYVEAQTAFDVAVANNESYMPAVFYLSQTHLALGNLGQAAQYSQKFYNSDPSSVQARVLRARIWIGNNRHDDAEQELRGLIDSGQGDAQVSQLLASSLFKQGKLDAAIAALESAPAPRSSAPVAAADPAKLNGSEVNGASLAVSELESLTDEQKAVVSVVELMVAEKFDLALDAAETMRNDYPASSTPHTLMGRILVVLERTDDARRAFSQALEVTPGNPSAGRFLAQLMIDENQGPAARRVYQSILDNNPTDLPTFIEFAKLEASNNNSRKMVELLEAAVETNKNALDPRVILARHYVTQQQGQKAVDVLDGIGVQHGQEVSVLSVRVRASLLLKDYTSAKTAIESLIKIQPEVADWRFLLAQLFTATGDAERAVSELKQTITIAPDNLNAHSALARLSFGMGDREQYNQSLAEIENQAPDYPGLAELREIAGNEQDSGSGELQASRQDTGTPRTTDSAVAEARDYWQDGNREKSLEMLGKWISENPSDLPARLVLANGYANNDQLPEAIAQYKKVLEIDKNNAVALNNLAWFLQDTDSVAALGYASHALELSPDSASTMDTMAVIQLKNGQIEKASETIGKAIALQPNNPSIRYHHSKILAAAGEKNNAKEKLQTLMSEETDFPERSDAIELLEKLVSNSE